MIICSTVTSTHKGNRLTDLHNMLKLIQKHNNSYKLFLLLCRMQRLENPSLLEQFNAHFFSMCLDTLIIQIIQITTKCKGFNIFDGINSTIASAKINKRNCKDKLPLSFLPQFISLQTINKKSENMQYKMKR